MKSVSERKFNVYELHIQGSKMWATATELNKLAGAGASVASGTQQAAIASPTGGTTTDTQARAAIDSIRAALTAFGITL